MILILGSRITFLHTQTMEFYFAVTDANGLRSGKPKMVSLYCQNTQEYAMLDLITTYPLSRDYIDDSTESISYRVKFEDENCVVYTMLLYGLVDYTNFNFIYILVDETKQKQYFHLSVAKDEMYMH